jgi:hypothetical protein
MSVATAREPPLSKEMPQGGATTMQSRQGERRDDDPQIMTETLLQKKRFLLFVKILFKSLEQSADSETRETAKQIVFDCTLRNRLGDPAFTPLMDAVDQHLRGKVGESHWRRAHVYMRHYLRRCEQEKARINRQQMIRERFLNPTQQAEV